MLDICVHVLKHPLCPLRTEISHISSRVPGNNPMAQESRVHMMDIGQALRRLQKIGGKKTKKGQGT